MQHAWVTNRDIWYFIRLCWIAPTSTELPRNKLSDIVADFRSSSKNIASTCKDELMNQIQSPASIYTLRQKLRQFLVWLILAVFGMIFSCVIIQILQISAVPSYASDNYNGVSDEFIFLSFVPQNMLVGVLLAVFFGYCWVPPIRVTEWRWLVLNALGMGIGNLANTLAIQWLIRYSYPIIIWIIVTAAIGVLFGVIQWLFLRQRTRSAGWWIPAMAAGWLVMWLMRIFMILVFSD